MSHREYRGWDIFYEKTHTGINWIARKEFADGGHKLRSETLEGIKAAIRLHK